MTLRFSFDSSALIGAWVRRLPPDVVPSFWQKLGAAIVRGEVRCIDEVQREIEKKTDDLLAWTKNQPSLVIPMSNDVMVAARAIINQFPLLTKPGGSRDAADPFVIAFAQTQKITVVTEEEPSNTPKKVKIPDVCNALGIRCINVYGFVRDQGWRF